MLFDQKCCVCITKIFSTKKLDENNRYLWIMFKNMNSAVKFAKTVTSLFKLFIDGENKNE